MAAEKQAAAVCQVCGERGQSAKGCWHHANQGSEKGKKSKKDKKDQRKGTRTKDADNKKRGADNNCNVVGHVALNCPKDEEERVTAVQVTVVEVICTT